MGTWEGEQKGGRVPYFAFELISKAVILFIFNGGTCNIFWSYVRRYVVLSHYWNLLSSASSLKVKKALRMKVSLLVRKAELVFSCVMRLFSGFPALSRRKKSKNLKLPRCVTFEFDRFSILELKFVNTMKPVTGSTPALSNKYFG